MNEQQQITYMQTRIIRMASERWQQPMKDVIALFHSFDVLGFIERCFGIFHMEGDDAVFEEVLEYLTSKGATINDKSV